MHTATRRFHSFALTHDDFPAFHAAYLVLTLLIAAMLNLGFFVLLIAAHMVLDVIKYREIHKKRWRQVIRATIRESLVDLMLLSIAIFFGVTLHHLTGVIALGGILRAEATILRGLALLLARLEILWHTIGVFTHIRDYMLEVTKGFDKPWTPFERVCIGVALGSLTLTALVPFALHLDAVTFARILADLLVPGFH